MKQIDAFFAIGKGHTVCQDYARADLVGGVPHLVVCDGCSGSPDTDVGARLLAMSALQELGMYGMREATMFAPDGISIAADEYAALVRASRFAVGLGMRPTCLDATLLVAQATNEAVRVSVRGDGAVAARRRDGQLVLHLFEYTSPAPFYLNYHMDAQRSRLYAKTYDRKVHHLRFERQAPADAWFSARIDMVERPWLVFPTDTYDVVMLLSDGVSSFQRTVETDTSRSTEPVPATEVVAELMSIKSFAGQFMHRRCRRFLDDFCAKHRWQHVDDFSVAALYLGEPA